MNRVKEIRFVPNVWRRLKQIFSCSDDYLYHENYFKTSDVLQGLIGRQIKTYSTPVFRNNDMVVYFEKEARNF